jgi:CD109 antigen
MTMLQTRILLLCSLLVIGTNADGSYIITAPESIQPGSTYSIKVDILNATDVFVQATIEVSEYNGLINQYQNRAIQNASGTFNKGTPDTLNIDTEVDIKCPSCRLRIRGSGGLQFEQVLNIFVISPAAVSMVQTDKAIYKPGQTVRFRAFAVYPDLTFYSGPITIKITDPDSNVVKVLANATSSSGVVEDSFTLGEQTVFGTWTIIVSLVNLENSQQSQTFEVSQYELPRFEITVELPPFALVDDDVVTVKVKASYTFGQPVKGYLELHITPNEGPNQCGEGPKGTQIGFPIDGEKSFTVPKEDIQRAVNIYNGQQARFTAFVKEEATGVRLNGSSVITWYSNKHQVKFTDNTPSVFKAGLPYKAFIQVTTPDNKPPTENNITVSVYTSVNYQLTVEDQALYDGGQFSGSYPLPGQNVTLPASGLLDFDITIPKNATSITIKATVKEVQSTKNIQKMYSKSNNFIQVTVLDKNIQSGSTVHIRIDGTEPLKEVVYEILSRGSLVGSGTLDGKGETSFISEFLVTPDFAPTAHLLVYYNRGVDEIVADSLALNVKGIFRNNVSISFDTTKAEPHTNVSLEVTAEPGSEVYILAVDQSVLLLRTGNDITPKKVGESVSKFNSKEKPSGSEFALSYSATNAQEAFAKIGLKLLTDIPASEQPQFARQLGVNRAGPPGYRAKARMQAEYISFDAPMAIMAPELPLAAVESVRQFFPEVFLWQKVGTRENGTATITAEVPDTITSWIANAYAAHGTAGLGVAPTTTTLKVFRSFFVSLTYPNNIVRGELVVIQAVVFNYLPNSQSVTVTLKESTNFQNVQTSKSGLEIHEYGYRAQEIKVDSEQQGVVYFPILATKIGVVEIEVTAQSQAAADGVRRQITVRPEGAPFSYNYPIFASLDGAGDLKKTIDFPLPDSAVNGSDSARITVTGDLIGSSLYSLGSLLDYPTACGEQAMAKMAPVLYIAQYLNATSQLTKATRKTISDLLEAGYQRQLTYKRQDGGFSPFGNRDGSGNTWLTAYVSSVLNQAQALTYIDPDLLINAVDWLVQRQNKDGSFSEFGNVLDSSTQGTGSGPSLTAFVLLSLIQNSPLSSLHCTPRVECYRTYQWGNATANAKRNLENLVDSGSVKNQFSLALVSYALTVAGSSKADNALTKLEKFAHREGGLLYWADNSTVTSGQSSKWRIWQPPREQTRPINILITSYAILAYTAQGKVKEAYPAVQWLSSQRNPSGGFASTQDTSVGLQALAAFATKSIRTDTDLNVVVTNNANINQFHIDKKNALVYQIKELSKAPAKVDVAIIGLGFVLVEIAVNLHVSKELSSSSFDVSTVLLDDDIDSFNLMVCTKYLWDVDSGMVVQAISIPSGFTPDLNSLGNVAGLKKSERKGQNLNVYFDKIGKTSICYSVRMARSDKVARTQENYVRTWVYYDPKNQSTVFWQPKKLKESSVCDVCDKCCQ